MQALDGLYKKQLIDTNDYNRISNSIKSFNVNPYELSMKLPGAFDLTATGRGGTQFFISPVYDTIISDIEGDGNSDEATKIEKMLMGFHNTMTPNHPQPTIDGL